MKATLEFKLPEEWLEYKYAINARRYKQTLDDINNKVKDLYVQSDTDMIDVEILREIVSKAIADNRDVDF